MTVVPQPLFFFLGACLPSESVRVRVLTCEACFTAQQAHICHISFVCVVFPATEVRSVNYHLQVQVIFRTKDL